jgi:hypothetical protein
MRAVVHRGDRTGGFEGDRSATMISCPEMHGAMGGRALSALPRALPHTVATHCPNCTYTFAMRPPAACGRRGWVRLF